MTSSLKAFTLCITGLGFCFTSIADEPVIKSEPAASPLTVSETPPASQYISTDQLLNDVSEPSDNAMSIKDQIMVEIGKTSILRLDRAFSAVIIGNPNVADVTAHNSKILFLSGKTYGTTNLLILDSNDRTVYESDVAVVSNSANLVTIQRGGDEFTYDCAPSCRPNPTVGDNLDHFDRVFGQIGQQKSLSE